MTPPDGFEPYKSTPRFTCETVPAALTRQHNTRAGVWGRIDVFNGVLTLTRLGGAEQVVDVLHAPAEAFVAPREPHFVALAPGTEFQVTFLRAP